MIVFITSFIPNPRINKRIEIAQGVDSVSVICVRRKDADIFTPNIQNVDYSILELDIPSHNNLFKRIQCFLKFFSFVFKRLRLLRPRILHVQGMDCLFLAVVYKTFHKTAIIYEVSDVREYFYSKRTTLYPIILKNIEAFLIKFISKLIVTSDQFYNQFYCKYLPPYQMVYIPNIPNLQCFSSYHKTKHPLFTVGFIGGIRYIDQMKMLISLTHSLPLKVIISGGAFTQRDEIELIEYSKSYPNVVFTGKYVYKTDIAELYEKIDCVYAVYNADNKNVQIALPNKLYESVYCELPIIVSSNTYLGEIVSELGVGVAVSHKYPQELFDAIKKMISDPSYYQNLVDHCIRNKARLLNNTSLDELKQIYTSFAS